MRLADFILENVEPILVEWEVFARGIWPGAATDPATLRDHAEEILRATVLDMKSDQTAAQQSDKSKGQRPDEMGRGSMNAASVMHAVARVGSGFELGAVIAEYRALRASVIRLWRNSAPTPDLCDIDDLTRFNESIDQSLTEAARGYAEKVARDREALLANEQASRVEADTANRAKDMFLANLSHEMRTPLNAIVGWITILRAKDYKKEDLEEGLAVIERNTKAQVQLIEDVLDVSRIVSGKLRLDMRPCELLEIINAGIDVMRPAADARDIALDVQLDPSASRATCDATRIQQVVWNLVSNAIKFTPKGGKVRVTLTREKSSLQIQVTDNGQGITPNLLPHVFDRFRQADSSTRRKFGGLGLGLSIVKHLVEMHGGTVEAQSQGEGRGSTFTVRLPILAVRMSPALDEPAEEDVAKTAHSLPLVRLDGLRVLVVDDDPDARRLLVKVLERAGAVVTAAGSAAEALEALAKERATERTDVLVSDLGMPDRDGYDLIREVRRRGYHAKDLPAVALTAFVHKDDAREALLAGFQVHLSKPVDPPDLTAVIASLAGRTGPS
ncbi:MAG TPA: ATP-binding protein [Tepidisphaeraceae bacterium]|jgi:signal transduction histidine kinase/ActR/RegA family two-component response regulator|nr:ATP-binding protein [Tepidisphaeraceae bacterium]